jgi:hypothetical protein
MKRWPWLLVPLFAWLQCRDDACQLAEAWHAPPPHYDYFQAIDFEEDGTGLMDMGEGQRVRSEVRFRYQVQDSAIALEYVAGSKAPPRTIRFWLEEGDFVVVEPRYDGERERHFQCRLRFEEDPFPPDVYSDEHLDYYACEL